MTINNVAICYYGMPRSIKSVYKSHQQFLFNVFKDNYMRYEIFMHTWDIGKYNIIKDKLFNFYILAFIFYVLFAYYFTYIDNIYTQINK